MENQKVLQRFQAFDTDAFEAVLGTDFFAQNEEIKYLSLQEPTHLLVMSEEQEWEAMMQFWGPFGPNCCLRHCRPTDGQRSAF